jgi:hypothetical protein
MIEMLCNENILQIIENDSHQNTSGTFQIQICSYALSRRGDDGGSGRPEMIKAKTISSIRGPPLGSLNEDEDSEAKLLDTATWPGEVCSGDSGPPGLPRVACWYSSIVSSVLIGERGGEGVGA